MVYGSESFFGPIRTSILHATPYYGPGNISLKFIIIDRHIVLQKIVSYTKKIKNQVKK